MSEKREDSEVLLVVQALDHSGNGSDIGTAHISLEELLDCGADHRHKSFDVVDRDGSRLGTLTASVSALKALKAIEAGGLPSDSAMSITVQELTLARPPKGQKLVVSVDLLGADAASSDAVELKAGEP